MVFNFMVENLEDVQIYNFATVIFNFGNKTASGNADGNGYGDFEYLFQVIIMQLIQKNLFG